MDTRADFQRLLEDMDKAIATKRQELSELDERLESARGQLSEKEAQELLRDQSSLAIALGNTGRQPQADQATNNNNPEPGALIGARTNSAVSNKPSNVDEYLQEQSKLYEQQLERFGEELSEFEIINQQLVNENERLKRQLEFHLEELEKAKVKSQLMKENLEELQSANLELNLRLAKAESELQTNQKLLKKTNQQDEVLMYALDDKLETLKRAIQLRDDEIKRLKLDNQFTLETIGVNKASGRLLSDGSELESTGIRLNDENNVSIELDERKQVIEIARTFREKDEQIDLLRGQLLQATRDLEQNANLLELMLAKREHHRLEDQSMIESSSDRSTLDRQLEELSGRLQLIENELEAKDEQLHLAKFRINHYEIILPNMISDLVRKLATFSAQLTSEWLLKSAQVGSRETATMDEDSIKSLMEELAIGLSRLPGELGAARALLDNIDQLREANELKEAQIRQLVNELNQFDVKFSLVQQQCDLLQQQQSTCTTTRNQSTSQLEFSSLAGADYNPLNGSQNVDPQPGRPTPLGGASDHECQVAGASRQRGDSNGARATAKLLSASGAPPKLARGQTQVSFEQADEGHQLASGNGKRSISLVGQQQQQVAISDDEAAALNGRAAPKNLSPVKGSNSANGTAQVAGSHDDGDRRNSKSVSNQNNGRQGKQVSRADELLQKRLEQLKSENELLELAMKEILLSIKWSDAQCNTILIDCPSLERLCQLIEARYLARAVAVGGQQQQVTVVSNAETGDLEMVNGEAPSSAGSTSSGSSNKGHLFQLIVLKSELDLLRGQNEQLRADVKLYKRDYQEMLKLCERTAIDSQRETLESNKSEAASSVNQTPAKAEGDAAISAEKGSAEDNSTDNDYSQLMIVAKCAPDDKLDKMSDANLTSSGLALGDKCSNCRRLAKLTGHLLQCIVRLETRVNMSEETYIGRLLSLRHLIQVLEGDLSIRDSLLKESQRECQLMAKQKLLSETKLQFVETELGFHLRLCPIVRLNSDATSQKRPSISLNHHHHNDDQPQTSTKPTSDRFVNNTNRLQVYTSTTASQSGLGESIQNLTSISSGGNQQQQVEHLPTMRSARLTITLLQSIISCLQARLDYKDERLRNLESLITQQSSSSDRSNVLPTTSGSNQHGIVRV